MEITLKDTNRAKSFKAEDLFTSLTQAMANIKAMIDQNDYQITGDIDQVLTPEILEAIKKSSLSKRKDLERAIYLAKTKGGIGSANRLLHFVLIKMLGVFVRSSAHRVRIHKSEKELIIQSVRKDWLKARDEAERLRVIYREEKKGFYSQKA